MLLGVTILFVVLLLDRDDLKLRTRKVRHKSEELFVVKLRSVENEIYELRKRDGEKRVTESFLESVYRGLGGNTGGKRSGGMKKRTKGRCDREEGVRSDQESGYSGKLIAVTVERGTL